MNIPSRLRRIGAIAGAAALLSTGVATPAVAQDEPEVSVSLSFSEISIDRDEASGGLDGLLFVGHNEHPDLPDEVTVEIDFSLVVDFLLLLDIGGFTGGHCTTAGTITTCEDVPLPDPDFPRALSLTVAVAPGASIGDTGQIELAVFGEGLSRVEESEQITVVGAVSRELLLGSFHFAEPVTPGELVSYQPTIHNSGTVTAEWIFIELFDSQYVRHDTRFSNCRYDDHDDGTSTAVCEFEIGLEPGETAQVPAGTPVTLRVLPHTPGGSLLQASYAATAFTPPLTGPEGEFGDGPPLPLVKVPDADLGDDPQPGFGNAIWLAGANPIDLAAQGAAITGGVGDVVTVAVGIENHGPADLAARQPGEGPIPPAQVKVSFPAGVTVLEVLRPEGDLQFVSGCFPVINGEADLSRRNEAAGRDYECRVSEIPLTAGQRWLFPFRVEITSLTPATGTVAALSHSDDPDPDNNSAPITLHGGGSGGGLPVTGTATTLTAAAGLLALAVGVALFLATRRRKIRFTAETG